MKSSRWSLLSGVSLDLGCGGCAEEQNALDRSVVGFVALLGWNGLTRVNATDGALDVDNRVGGLEEDKCHLLFARIFLFLFPVVDPQASESSKFTSSSTAGAWLSCS